MRESNVDPNAGRGLKRKTVIRLPPIVKPKQPHERRDVGSARISGFQSHRHLNLRLRLDLRRVQTDNHCLGAPKGVPEIAA